MFNFGIVGYVLDDDSHMVIGLGYCRGCERVYYGGPFDGEDLWNMLK